MKFGAPEDLQSFATALQEQGSFPAELGSITRSILYREHGKIAIPDLLEMMTVAMGGERIAEMSAQVREPVRDLLLFISTEMRNGRALAPDKSPHAIETLDPDLAGIEPLQTSESDPPTAPAAGIPLQDTADIYARAKAMPPVAPTADVPAELKPLHADQPAASARTKLESKPDDRQIHLAGVESAEVQTQTESGPRGAGWLWSSKAAALSVLLCLVALAVFFFTHRRSQGTTGSSAASPLDATASNSPPVGAAIDQANTSGTSQRSGNGRVTISTPRSGTATSSPLQAETSGGEVISNSSLPGSAAAPEAGNATTQGNAVTQTQGKDGTTSISDPSHSSTESAAAKSDKGLSNHQASPTRSRSGRRGGVYTVSSGVMAGNLISAPPPHYPRVASLFHVEGQVILQAVVSRSGRVSATHIIRGHRLLRGAAQEAVRKWRYRPYLINGQPTDVATIVTVDFRQR